VLNTTNNVTANYTHTTTFFTCTRYVENGSATSINCTIGSTYACTQSGVVGCTLHYQDVNVTSALRTNKTARLCKGDWASYASFDKVAYVEGSILAPFTGPGEVNGPSITEIEAVALVQVLKAVDANISIHWAKEYVIGCVRPHIGATKILLTPVGTDVKSSWSSSLIGPPSCVNVVTLSFEVSHTTVALGPNQPTFNEHLAAALISLRELQSLSLSVGTGELLPQLGSLSSMATFDVRHFCLRGHLPSNLLSSWGGIRTFMVTGTDGAVDLNNNQPCGVRGALQSYRGNYSYLQVLELSNNLFTGTLPMDLMTMGVFVALHSNRLSGTLPPLGHTTTVLFLDLSNNLLKVCAVQYMLCLSRCHVQECMAATEHLFMKCMLAYKKHDTPSVLPSAFKVCFNH
jgi:hypothetical protein